MIEISLGKMVLLALIALIVLGPEKLPGAARTAGALLRRVRSGWDNVRAEVERELEIEEIRRTARAAAAEAEVAHDAMKDMLQQAHEPLADAAAIIKSTSDTHEPPVVAPADIAHDIIADERASQMQAELPLGEPAATPHTREATHGGA